MKIRIGIAGYGNLGKGVEASVLKSPDMELVGIFTRREPEKLIPHDPSFKKVYSLEKAEEFKNDIDVMVICAGSATDLPEMTPYLAKHFNVIDSFDTHANIKSHFENVDKAAKIGNKTAIISVGWDPGMFSIMRLYSEAILPDGETYTFWGKGVSQGHSDAIRRIKGVKDAKQYTVPISSAIERVRSGEMPELSTREKHLRECFVVAEENADLGRIETEIKTMPNYFADYETKVYFISEEELYEKHGGMPHGGFVIRSGKTGYENECNNTIEYSLKLDSNPQFTASALTAFARAAFRLSKTGNFGCKTVFDIPPSALFFRDEEYSRVHLL